MTTIPALALQQFHQRQRFWQRQRTAGQCSADEANARLMSWFALALLAGADPARLHPQAQLALDDLVGPNRFMPPHVAVQWLANDHCPRAEAVAELARARDAAIDALAAPPSQTATGTDPQGPQGRTAARSEGRQAESEDSQAADAALARNKRAAENARALAQLGNHFHAPGYRGTAFAAGGQPTERQAA